MREREIDSNNNIVNRKYITMKVVTDERTVDGHYYASAFKLFRTLVQHPERLEVAPVNLQPDVD
jgi:pyruvate/2-oxoglutarate dehydrogenase complex dihydrolipoamide acyltransferase (E2) component